MEEEKEEDAKTQRIILYVCVCIYIYIYIQSQIHRKQRAPKRRTKERMRNIRIKESQREVFSCVSFLLVSKLLFGQKFEKN